MEGFLCPIILWAGVILWFDWNLDSNAATVMCFPYSETLWNQAHLYPKPSAKNGSVEDLEQRLEMFLLVSQSLICFSVLVWYLLITWIYLPVTVGNMGIYRVIPYWKCHVNVILVGTRLQKARQERMALEKQLAGDPLRIFVHTGHACWAINLI